jgi:hypothetical protein
VGAGGEPTGSVPERQVTREASPWSREGCDSGRIPPSASPGSAPFVRLIREGLEAIPEAPFRMELHQLTGFGGARQPLPAGSRGAATSPGESNTVTDGRSVIALWVRPATIPRRVRRSPPQPRCILHNRTGGARVTPPSPAAPSKPDRGCKGMVPSCDEGMLALTSCLPESR